MARRNYKNGLTLIEILVSILIVSIISLSSYYIVSRIYQINIVNDLLIDETLVIQNSYDIFYSDPTKFKKNLEMAYPGTWEDDTYVLKQNIDVKFKIEEGKKFIRVKIIKHEEEIEVWERKKVIP